MKYYVSCFAFSAWFILRVFGQHDSNNNDAAARPLSVINKAAARSILDKLENEKRRLFEVAFANQDTLSKLQEKVVKPKRVIVRKIEYVKVYKTVPIYLPEADTEVYREPLKNDTLENDYLILPHGTPPDTAGVKRRKSFFHRLFH